MGYLEAEDDCLIFRFLPGADPTQWCFSEELVAMYRLGRTDHPAVWTMQRICMAMPGEDGWLSFMPAPMDADHFGDACGTVHRDAAPVSYSIRRLLPAGYESGKRMEWPYW